MLVCPHLRLMKRPLMDRSLRPPRLMRPIELAHCSPFRIGNAQIRPATREVIAGGQRRILEPRVMQVLVALGEANGEILSRSDLNDLCWDGVAVSDDAWNRVISRLRALARESGEFQIETINKVGYRLTPDNSAPAIPDPLVDARRPAPLRRTILAGAGLTVAAAAGAAWWRFDERARRARQVDALSDHAWEGLRSQDADGVATAISSLRLALKTDPDNARAWGMLALAHSWASQGSSQAESRASAAQARDAIARALERDPDSELALAARAFLLPVFRNWRAAEMECREALARWPRSALLLNRLTDVLLQAGRWRDALPVSASLQARDLFSPSCWRLRALTLQDNGRIEEAGQAIQEGLRLYPRHADVWFTNLNLLTDTGRIRDAMAFLGDRPSRPIGIGDESWALTEQVTRTLDDRTPQNVEATMVSLYEAIPKAGVPVGRAIIFAVAVDRLDDAFRMAEDYFFGRGQAGEIRRAHTHFLFHSHTAPMRADPRFTRLAETLGLERYWREAGAPPDFRKADFRKA